MQDYVKFKELLEEKYDFPCKYKFKFVVPSDQRDEITSLFPAKTITEKQSRTGKYTSFTIDMDVLSADHVIDTYKSCSQIKNLIML